MVWEKVERKGRKGEGGKRSVRVRVAKGETWRVRGGGMVRVQECW